MLLAVNRLKFFVYFLLGCPLTLYYNLNNFQKFLKMYEMKQKNKFTFNNFNKQIKKSTFILQRFGL